MWRRLAIGAALLVIGCGDPQAEHQPAPADPAPTTDAEGTLTAPLSPTSVDLSATVAGLYKIDPDHAHIAFSYDHMGYSRPLHRWRAWTADLSWNPRAPEQSSLVVLIEAASIDSGAPAFDGHLKSADFFDAAVFPTISFKSASVEMSGGDTGKIAGDLTIRGVTKPVILYVKINKAANDDFAKSYKLGFSASTVIMRSDFGLDKYVPAVGDDVNVEIEAEFVMPREGEIKP